MRLLQGTVALLDLVQHVIEAVDQLPHLIFILLLRPNGIILLDRHRAGGPGQAQEWFGDEALEAAGEDKGYQRGGQQNSGHNQSILLKPLRQSMQIRLQTNRSNPVTFERDRFKQEKLVILELVAV